MIKNDGRSKVRTFVPSQNKNIKTALLEKIKSKFMAPSSQVKSSQINYKAKVRPNGLVEIDRKTNFDKALENEKKGKVYRSNQNSWTYAEPAKPPVYKSPNSNDR